MDLKNARVLMVDDTGDWIERFRGPLAKAAAEADFLLHADATAGELAGEILRRSPDVLLLDGYLANGMRGDQVARLLKESGFAGRIVGFSMVPSFKERFEAAGVDAIVKETDDPERSIERLAILIA